MAERKPLVLIDGVPRQLPAEDHIPAGEWTAETVSQAEAEEGTATTRRAWTALLVRQAIEGWWSGLTTAFSRTFVQSVSATAARTNLGLGTAATRAALGTTGALYSRDSILGTVSQSSGIPTGAIIERGSNANGAYVRFADGTQICTNNLAYPAGNTAYLWTFPATFADLFYHVSVSSNRAIANNTLFHSIEAWHANTGAAYFKLLEIGPSSINYTSSNKAIKGLAIGRWF